MNNALSMKDGQSFCAVWSEQLRRTLPNRNAEILAFAEDEDKGLWHSYEVYSQAMKLASAVRASEPSHLNMSVIEQICVFHDIGKYFEKIHSLGNLSIAENVYREYASKAAQDEETILIVLDGIARSDFYNDRLDPGGKPPSTLEGEVVRCADKMLPNIVRKVDRYWFEYGVPRGATFFRSELSTAERATFSFKNFAGDQLNVILSLVGLRPRDFVHPTLAESYRSWAKEWKPKVESRILELANELGMEAKEIRKLQDILLWYRTNYYE